MNFTNISYDEFFEDDNITDENGQHMPRPYYVEDRIARIILEWGFPVVIVFGTFGNIMAFVVLVHRRMRSMSVNFYLALLACADTGVLYVSGFKTWLRQMTGFELLHVSDAGCRIIYFLLLLFMHMSAWLVVAVSVDRFVAVWFPFKALTLCSARRARISGIIGFVVLAIGNCHIFWNYSLQTDERGRDMCLGRRGDFFVEQVFPWLRLATYSFIPFVLVLVLNVCILIKVISSYRGISSNSGDERHTSARASRESRVTSMLLVVSFSWLALTGPFTWWPLLASKPTGPREVSQTKLLKYLSFLLMYLNHGINFYLYCLTGNKFRQELGDICCNKRSKRGTSKVYSRTTLTTTYIRQ